MTVSWKDCGHYTGEELQDEQEDNNPKRNTVKKVWQHIYNTTNNFTLQYIYNTL